MRSREQWCGTTRRLYALSPVTCLPYRARSPSVVIAYLMKKRGWRLAESYKWVKDKRQTINIKEGKRSQGDAPECGIRRAAFQLAGEHGVNR